MENSLAKPKVTLVLGSGGARGLAHLGVLKVLKEEAITVTSIIGVSMGAAIGAYFSLGFDIYELEKYVVSLNKRKAITSLLDLNNPTQSIIKGKKLNKFISKLLKDSSFSDTKIPLRILGTDLANGEEVIMDRGKLAEAVQASIAVPGIFPPVKRGSGFLVDGGVVNPTPIDLAIKDKPDLIIAVDLTIKRKADIIKPNMVTTLMQSYEIIRTHSVLSNAKHRKKVVMIMPETRGTIDSFKFHHIEKFIASGEKSAKEKIGIIKRRLK